MNENDRPYLRSRELALPLLALWSFAVAQPLYDLLAANPTYLTAHELIGTSLFVFIALISVGLPLLLIVIALLAGRIHSSLLILVRVLAVAFLMGLFNGLLRRLGLAFAPGAELSLTGLLSLFLVWRFAKTDLVLDYLRLASVAALIFPAVFIWQLPKSYLVDFRSSLSPAFNQMRAPLADKDALPEIVLVIFDELALTTLIKPVFQAASGTRGNADPKFVIDAVQYPNIAAFGAQATWYRQASTVAAGTRLAVPAILTGQEPDLAKSPDAASHPDNIFARLIGTYALNVEEPITRLCNYPACQRSQGVRLIVEDTVVVLGHIAGPTWLVNRLPPIGGHWIGFWAADTNLAAQREGVSGSNYVDERVASIERFVVGLEEASSPGLHVLHSLLPHVPYTLLPQGQRLFRHAETPDRSTGHVIDQLGDRFVEAPWSVNESRHFYQWQLGYVDLALGKIVERLKALQKYDNALIIVTADHGVRFVPGKSRREPEPRSFIDIASIPLIVKAPGQIDAQVNDRAIVSTDIRQIIEQSLLAGNEPKSPIGRFDSQNGSGGRRAILSSTGWVALPEQFDFSARQNLPLGNNLPVTSLEFSEPPPICTAAPAFALSEEGVYQNTHPDHFLAAHVLFEAADVLPARDLTVVVNNSPAAVYQTGPLHYSAFIAPELLQPGYNSVQLLKGRGDSACTLYTLPQPKSELDPTPFG